MNLRAPIRRTTNSTLEHWRAAVAPDGIGGQSSTWTKLGELRARVPQPTRSTETSEADADGTDLTVTVYVLPPDADVRRGDELRATNTVLQVIAAYTPSGAIYLRCDCQGRQPEVS